MSEVRKNRPYTCPGCNTEPELVKDADFNKTFYQCPNGCLLVPTASTVSEAIELWNKSVKEYIEKHTVKNDTPRILDSGNRTEFATGAVRDMREGKGRMDLMPLGVVEEILNDDSMVIHGIRCYMEEHDTRYLYFALASFVKVAYNDCRETMLLEVGKQFEEGAKKYGENNWQKGIEPKYYIDSAIRHYLKWRRGDKDEPHDRAFVWNIMCCIWECDFHVKEEKKDIPDSLPIDDYDAPCKVEPYSIPKTPSNAIGVVYREKKETKVRTCLTCKYCYETYDPHCNNCRYNSNWEDREKVDD